MIKVRLLEETSAREVIFTPATLGKKGEFMIDEGNKHVDREIPEDSLRVFGLALEKSLLKKALTKLLLLCRTLHVQMNFWNNQTSLSHKGQRNSLS